MCMESNLKRHINELHEDIRNHVCKKCGYTASIRKGSLEAVHENKMSHVQSFKYSHALLQCVSSSHPFLHCHHINLVMIFINVSFYLKTCQILGLQPNIRPET